eukprot:gene16782-19936_t
MAVRATAEWKSQGHGHDGQDAPDNVLKNAPPLRSVSALDVLCISNAEQGKSCFLPAGHQDRMPTHRSSENAILNESLLGSQSARHDRSITPRALAPSPTHRTNLLTPMDGGGNSPPPSPTARKPAAGNPRSHNRKRSAVTNENSEEAMALVVVRRSPANGDCYVPPRNPAYRTSNMPTASQRVERTQVGLVWERPLVADGGDAEGNPSKEIAVHMRTTRASPKREIVGRDSTMQQQIVSDIENNYQGMYLRAGAEVMADPSFISRVSGRISQSMSATHIATSTIATSTITTSTSASCSLTTFSGSEPNVSSPLLEGVGEGSVCVGMVASSESRLLKVGAEDQANPTGLVHYQEVLELSNGAEIWDTPAGASSKMQSLNMQKMKRPPSDGDIDAPSWQMWRRLQRAQHHNLAPQLNESIKFPMLTKYVALRTLHF